MSAGANFFVVSCAILIFSIINLSIGPVINKAISNAGNANCKIYVDQYDDGRESMTDEQKKNLELTIRECRNRKAMSNMEYTSCIFNIFIAFVCVLLGLYGLQKEIIPKTGYIGMGCGVVGLILTLVYVIYNGVVYTNYNDSEIYKVDGDGAFAEYVEEKSGYECFYYKKDDENAVYAKYCDLIKSQYNYDYDLIKSFSNNEKNGCTNRAYPSSCKKEEYITRQYKRSDGSLCTKLYYFSEYDTYHNSYINYNKSARFLTVLLLSILILLCYCGLIFSGFMLTKEQS